MEKKLSVEFFFGSGEGGGGVGGRHHKGQGKYKLNSTLYKYPLQFSKLEEGLLLYLGILIFSQLLSGKTCNPGIVKYIITGS